MLCKTLHAYGASNGIHAAMCGDINIGKTAGAALQPDPEKNLTMRDSNTTFFTRHGRQSRAAPIRFEGVVGWSMRSGGPH